MRTSVFSLVVLCSLVSATVAKHRALTRDDLTTAGITPPAPKQDGPTTAKPLGLILLPFPQAANNVQSLVDISPQTIAAIQSGGSPYAGITAFDDPSEGSSTTTSAPWSAAPIVHQFSAFVDKIQTGSNPRPRPSKPSSIAQLGIFTVTPAATSTQSTQNDPLPTSLQGLVAGSQTALGSAANAAQTNANQLGTNVQSGINSFLGITTSKPANDEPVTSTAASTTSATTTAGASSSSSAASTTVQTSSTTTPAPGTTTANGTTNPFDAFVSNVQVVSGQVGSNVQNGLAGLLQLASYRPGLKAAGSKDATSPVQGVFGRLAATPTSDGTAVKAITLKCDTCAPGQDVCSPVPALRIVNGKEVNNTTEFPFLVLITYQDSPSGQGALINDRWFVTTAHIVDSLTNIGLIRAVVNTLKSSSGHGPSNSRRIASKLSHPDYVSTNLFANNVGLMALEKPFTTFTPVCLPTQATFTSPPTMATVVGWGTTTPNGHGPSLNLQQADLLMFPSIVCQQSYPQVSSQNLCGGSIKPSPGIPATCAGDGGDPLVFHEGSAWKLLGIALDIPNVGCQNSEQLSVFADVAPFVNWINTNAPGCKCGEVPGDA